MFYDISPEISPDMAVFPGDTPFSLKMNMSFAEKNHLDLSEMTTTVHLGAHTDAPSHYHPEGKTMEKRDLQFYMGPCQVITIEKPRGERIFVKDVEKVCSNLQAPRVLFKTNSFPNPNEWNDDFNSLSAELIDCFAKRGIRLVGIDTPSVDPATDKELSSHKAIYENDMAVLEGIVLTEVPDGIYNLVALPLKIKGADASPVRAILIPEED